jgi:hypothetical protein
MSTIVEPFQRFIVLATNLVPSQASTGVPTITSFVHDSDTDNAPESDDAMDFTTIEVSRTDRAPESDLETVPEDVRDSITDRAPVSVAVINTFRLWAWSFVDIDPASEAPYDTTPPT